MPLFNESTFRKSKILFHATLWGVFMVGACTSLLSPHKNETPTFVQMPSPTFTIEVTITHLPTLIPKPSLVPLPTNTYIPISTSMPTPPVRLIEKSVSPNGKWIATTEEGFFQTDYESAILRVKDTDTEHEWIAEVVTDRIEWEVIRRPLPLSWSQDEKFLFFTHHVTSDGCFPSGNGSDVYRLDLRTGEVIEIVSKVGYWYAVSPNGHTLAYLSYERGLVIRDLVTGYEEETHFDIELEYEGVYVTDLFWSPDNSFLIALVNINMCISPNATNSIIRIDLPTLEQTTLVHENDLLLAIVNWSTMDRVLIKTYPDENFWMDPNSGELSAINE